MVRKYFKGRMFSFRYAFQGLRTMWRTQPNFRIHIVAAVVVTGMGFAFSVSGWEWCTLILCIALVLMAEAFNSALEFLTDLVSPDYHDLAGKAKDAAAAAVLIMALGASVVGFLIFVPKIGEWIGRIGI